MTTSFDNGDIFEQNLCGLFDQSSIWFWWIFSSTMPFCILRSHVYWAVKSFSPFKMSWIIMRMWNLHEIRWFHLWIVSINLLTTIASRPPWMFIFTTFSGYIICLIARQTDEVNGRFVQYSETIPQNISFPRFQQCTSLSDGELQIDRQYFMADLLFNWYLRFRVDEPEPRIFWVLVANILVVFQKLSMAGPSLAGRRDVLTRILYSIRIHAAMLFWITNVTHLAACWRGVFLLVVLYAACHTYC